MPDLTKLKTEFINSCLYEKKLSPKTLKAYEIDLRQFIHFLIEQKCSLHATNIDKNVLRAYIQCLSSAKPKTIRRKIATLRAFFNHLESEDYIEITPFRKLRFRMREPKVLPNVMSIQEIERIMRFTYNAKQNLKEQPDSVAYQEAIRDIAVVEFLFATGVRVSELSNLCDTKIDLETGRVGVKGKGNKERIIQVCNEDALFALKEYYTLFKKQIQQCGFFFVNRKGTRLSEQSVRFLVRKYTKLSGLERKITPHAFRHTFATLLLEEDVDIKYIQHLLGHSSIMTTQIYTHVNAEKQRQILERHPRKKIRARCDF